MAAEVHEVGEAEVLGLLADSAAGGVTALIVIGKVTAKQVYPARDGRASETVCKVVAGEGVSMGVRFADGAAVPGVFQRGAFLINAESIYKGKNGLSVDCLMFSAK